MNNYNATYSIAIYYYYAKYILDTEQAESKVKTKIKLNKILINRSPS